MAAKKIKNSGLTLVELMVANAIAILAFAVLFVVSFTIQDNIGITSGVLGITEKGRFAINRISIDIREAERVISSHGGYSTDDDTVILKVLSIKPGTGGDIFDPSENKFDYITYTLDSDDPEKLVRIVDANAASSRSDTTEVIVENIDTLLFLSKGTGLSSITNLQSINTVTVKIITKTTSPDIGRQNEIITSSSLRNKSMGF